VKEDSGNGASLSAGALLGEPGGRGDPEGYGEEGSGDGHLCGGPFGT